MNTSDQDSHEEDQGPPEEALSRWQVSIQYPDNEENRKRGKVGQWYEDASTTGPNKGYPSWLEALGRILELEAQGLTVACQLMTAGTINVYVSGTS